jgi:hypothetical protein
MKKTTTKSYALRIDGPLVKPLQELKKQNRRSLNAEINAALEAWVAAAHTPNTTLAAAASSSKSVDGSHAEVAPTQPRAKKQAKRKSANATVESAAASGSPTSAS